MASAAASVMSQPARAALATLILAVSGPAARAGTPDAAAVARPAAAAGAQTAWFEVTVPGGVAALAQAAGLDPATEPWRLLPDLTRRLYAPFGERTGPRVIGQVAAVLAGGPLHPAGRTPAGSPAADVVDHTAAGDGVAAAPAPRSVDDDRVPIPLTPEAWREILGADKDKRGLRDVLSAVTMDAQAARLFRGLSMLDAPTLAALARETHALREVLRHNADTLSAFAASFHVQDGRVAVPGGHALDGLWQDIVGASVVKPGEFLVQLAAADEGRVFFFYDAVDRLDEPHRRFALAAAETDRGRREERVRALRRVFAQAEPWWGGVRPPFSRRAADPARLLEAARVDERGVLAAPNEQALWAAAFADQVDAPPEWRARLEHSPPADAAWLAERIGAIDPSLGRSRLLMLAFAQRVFSPERGRDAPDPALLLAALRGFGRYRALALTLERMGIRDPALHAAAARQAERLYEAGTGGHARASLAEFQGALAIVERAWQAGTLDSAAADARARTLVAVPLEDGRYHDGIARWIQDDLLPALRARAAPAASSAEAVVLRAMAGPAGDSPRIEWEGLVYDLDPAAAEYDRLRRIRARQGGSSLDDALAAGGADRESRLASVLTDLVYAAALGPAEGGPAASENAARRHEFGFEEAEIAGGPRAGWAIAREVAGAGQRWHARGALLGLDVALARLTLRRLDSEVPPAPLLTAADRRAFAEGVVLMRPAALDDAGRDAVAEALRRGRAVVAAAADDPAALQRIVARLPVRDWRRSTLPWLAARHPDDLQSAFTLGEIAWLGATDAPALPLPSAWGTSARVDDGCLCARLAPPAPWDALAGRAADGRLAALAPDLHLRVAELLAEMRLPARLAPAVLALAAQDLVDGVQPAFLEDGLAVTRYARALTRTRVEDYVAALVGRGPLVPAAER